MKKKFDRSKSLIEYLLAKGSVRIDELADHFEVSRMTIHRDVSDLVERGIVRRDHGVVTMQASVYYESNYWYRSTLNKIAKQALAHAAAEIVNQYNTIILDDSTTSLELLSFLELDATKTIVSNSAAALPIIESSNASFLQLGGSYNRIYNSYLGILCEATLRTITADVAYISSSSLDDDSLYHQDESVIRVKREMIRSSRIKILAVDETKFSQQALYRICPLTDFDHIFCYVQQKAEVVQRMADRGLPVVLVS